MNVHVNSTTTPSTPFRTIDSAALDALTVAIEFLSCSIRALAHGADIDSQEARQGIDWALAKLAESKGKRLLIVRGDEEKWELGAAN